MTKKKAGGNSTGQKGKAKSARQGKIVYIAILSTPIMLEGQGKYKRKATRK